MPRILRPSSLWLATLLACPLPLQAVSVTINNPSFENPITPAATFQGSMTAGPAGWNVYNAGATNTDRYFGVWNPANTDSYRDPVPHGANIGVVFLDNDSNFAEAGLQQTLGSSLQLSTQYTLRVEVGNFDPGAGSAPWDFTGFPGYRVDLLAGTTVIASDNNTLSPGEGRFLTSTVSLTIGAGHPNFGQALGIRLVNLNGPGVEVNFDRVTLDAVAVPEPAATGLIAFGALLLAARRVCGRPANGSRPSRRRSPLRRR